MPRSAWKPLDVDGLWAIYGNIPANPECVHYTEEYFTMQKYGWIGLKFFFSSELSYSPASPQV